MEHGLRKVGTRSLPNAPKLGVALPLRSVATTWPGLGQVRRAPIPDLPDKA